ncbi:helix-turn-helix domain-containing protein [Streptomyces sp. NBC_01298]|uniref:winged helix-turn-helix transcriptional regulator n=1 Tax=Streptomyces sp. NBC_01298 TaxID=2903817 RepID=UPI002E0F6CF3|nr:helix-turn-helix domain-containing protein [Streptomyces sp. NBC_01298]
MTAAATTLTRICPGPGRASGKAAAKAEYDAFFAACPSRQLLERISDKWVALVLAALGGDGPGTTPGDEPRPMRFSELQRRISGVSQKMLTQTLRALERDGMVTRTVTPTVPVTHRGGFDQGSGYAADAATNAAG